MKKSICFLLSMLIFAVSLPGMALALGKEYDGANYEYIGEITENGLLYEVSIHDLTERVEDDERYYVGYQFASIHADKAGYYCIITQEEENYKFSSIAVCGVKDNAMKETKVILNDSNDECGRLLYLDANEDADVFLTHFDAGSVVLRFLYLGEIQAVSDVTPLVRVADTYCDEETGVLWLYPYVTISFREHGLLKLELFAEAKANLKEDYVEATVAVLQDSCKVTIPLIDADALVTNVTYPEGFSPQQMIYFDGSLRDVMQTDRFTGGRHNESKPEYLWITFPNGEVKQVGVGESLKLANGKSYDLWATYSTDYLDVNQRVCKFQYGIPGICMKTEKTKIVTPSMRANMEKIAKAYQQNVRSAIKIFKGEAVDWTKSDAFMMLISYPRMVWGMVRNDFRYSMSAWTVMKYALIVLAVVSLIFGIVMLILILKRKRKNGKKG